MKFKVGDYFVYDESDAFEIGKVIEISHDYTIHYKQLAGKERIPNKIDIFLDRFDYKSDFYNGCKKITKKEAIVWMI